MLILAYSFSNKIRYKGKRNVKATTHTLVKDWR